MSFLIRIVFWLVILVLVLPTDAKQQSQVYGTAEAAVKDVTGFCVRNPNVCETGKGAFDLFVHKAQFGVQMIMSFVEGSTTAEGTSAPEAPGAPEAPEPSLPAADATSGTDGAALPWQPTDGEASDPQGTLTPSDLEPAWSGAGRHG